MKIPDLHDLELSGVHVLSGDAHPVHAAATAAKLKYFSADLKTVDSKAALLTEVAKGLKLPEHFGSNWDALADSLEDGDWVGKNGCVIVLTNAGPYRKAHGVDWTTFEDILAEASDYWRERHKPFWTFVS
jgi:RNAse (barnase) inhibitor barstar